jgi:diguanylate cyclase (GGDEF)-like protein/PAS domain S-box-containing protein
MTGSPSSDATSGPVARSGAGLLGGVWVAALLLGLACALSSQLAALPADVARSGAQLVMAVVAAVALHAAAGRATTLRPSWLWAARATTAWAAGQALLTAATAASAERPVLADLFFLVAAGGAVTAASGVVRGHVHGRRAVATLVLDALLVAVAVLLLVHGQVSAALDDQGLLALAYPLIDVMILTALLVAAARGPREQWASLGSAALGLAVLASANLETLRRDAAGQTPESPGLAALFVVAFALVATGGLLHRSGTAPVRGSGSRAHDLLPYFAAPLALVTAAQPEVSLSGLQRTLLVVLAALVTARHVLTLGDVARAAASLADSHSQYRRIVETASEGIWLSDADGVATFVNEQACQMMGLPVEAVLGRRSAEVLLPLLDADGIATVAARAADRTNPEPARFTLRVRRPDGTTVHCYVVSAPVVTSDGRFDGTLTMATDVTERVALESALWEEARTDPLTGLANRTLLLESAAAAFADRRPVSLVFCDLDGFKAVNDSYGHGEGDAVLREVALRLSALATDEVLVSRLGGDEFALLLTDAAAPTAELLARQVLRALEVPYGVGSRLHHLTASAGVASSAHAEGVEALLRNADIAMYAAKSARSGLCAFAPEMHVRAVEHAVVAAELRACVAEGQLRVHYQPVVSLADRSLIGVEALVRWQHPERGLLSPAAFVDVAEEEGLIVAIGQHVLETALADAEARAAAGLPSLQVSVNVSPRQLAEPSAVSAMVAAVESCSLPAELVTFEITERSLLAGESAAASIRQLHRTGARIALDDFGTGWSSLSHLRDHPVDALKLDLSYVQAEDPRSAQVLRAAAALARGLGAQSVAEGVETEEQAARAASVGCHAAQGWLFGRPVDHDALVARMALTVPQPRSAASGADRLDAEPRAASA